MDIRIKLDDTKSEWSFKLCDKREATVEKGLKLNKFPHLESILTSRYKYGVITSQLHGYGVDCSSQHAFMVRSETVFMLPCQRIQHNADQSLLQLIHTLAQATLPSQQCTPQVHGTTFISLIGGQKCLLSTLTAVSFNKRGSSGSMRRNLI